MALIKQWYAEKTKKITPNLCISEPPKGRETEQALSYAHAKNQATKLHMVITFNESSISKYLWWGLFGKNEKDSFISFWTLPCIETEQQTDKSSAFGPGPADCSRRKHTIYSKSDQVRAQGRWPGGSGKGCRKGCHAFTWWPARELRWESLPLIHTVQLSRKLVNRSLRQLPQSGLNKLTS